MSTDARQGTTSRVMANVLRYAEAKNLSLTDLAGAAGVQPYRISKWRRGTGSPPLSVIVRFARALGVTADELLEGVGGAPQPQPPDGPTPEERIMDAIALAVTHGYVPGDPRFGIADMMVRILTAPGDRYDDIFDAARAANDEAADAEGWDEEREGED
jgi:transcriptional regulator with XRE-family HTH domain